MLTHSKVNGVSTWSSSNGELQAWKPAAHVLVTKFQGALFDAEFAKVLMEAVSEMASGPYKPDIFHDWGGMELYATESRVQLTELAMELSTRVNSLNVLPGSKVVRMGVSMAAIQLKGVLRMHERREEFEQALQQALASPAPR